LLGLRSGLAAPRDTWGRGERRRHGRLRGISKKIRHHLAGLAGRFRIVRLKGQLARNRKGRSMNELDIFSAALELETPAARAAYLDQECGDDAQLRRRIESLLESHKEAGSFMDSSAPPLGPTIKQPFVESPGTVIGPYKLLQQIGEGGMGTVFMAEQTQPVQR